VTVELPYGRKRALEIATTLATEPELMLLDEPTQGMGHEDVERVTQLIKKVSANRTVLMVEHNMNVVANIADTNSVLQRGQVIAEGPCSEVSRNPQGLEAYMGSASEELRGAHGQSRQRVAAGQRPARVLRRVAHPARRRPHRGPRRGRDAAGAQWRRSDDDAEVDPRAGRPAQRLDHDQRRRGGEPAAARDRAARYRLLPRGARHLRQP